jgi:hypothetical protein
VSDVGAYRHLAGAILLGSGERLFADLGGARFEQTGAVEAPGVTHLTYRVVRRTPAAFCGGADSRRRGACPDPRR